MGAGSTALLWYGMCCCSVAFVGLVASGLIGYGERQKKKKRAARLAAREKKAGSDASARNTEAPQAGAPEPPTDA